MSYYPNPNRHVYVPSSTHTRVSVRPNLSWSTIQEESSTDLLSSELNEKQERIDRLKKLERLKERRYMDYQSLKRRGSSKEYSERFQRDCEEFNKLKYRQVHHKKSSLHVPPSKHRSISVSDVTNRHYFTSSRYGRTYLRGNQDDGQTLSPTGSISSIVTLDDDYMYGSRYSAEDHWGSWQPRSRTSSFSTSMARDRLGYGLSSHEMLDDNLFDDASSEYSYSAYMPQRRAFSSSVTPRRYTGLMTPTAQSADAIATEERMNQLSERLRTLQNERLQLERRRSVDLSSSHVRSHLPSSDSTETATSSVYSRFNQNSQTNILPQSPTDHSVPHWSQRVNLLLSSHQGASNVTSDMEYGGSHFEYGSRYTTDGISKFGSELPDSTLSADVSSSQSFHSTDLNESHDGNYHSPTLKSSILSRSFIYQKPEITSTPLSNPTFETRQERISVHSPSHLSMTTAGTHQESFPFGASHGQENSQFRHGNVRRVFNMNLQQPTNSSTTHVLRDGQLTDSNHNYQRSSEKSNINEMPLSPLSPASRKSFMTYEKKSVITQSGQQDEVSDSGVESASDVGRVSSSVSSDSISKFLVSASKPSESRGVPKFEIGFESPGQREYGPKLSPGGTTYHSVQEGTARDGQNSTSYPSPTTSRDGTYSSEFQHLQGSKMDIETTKENNTDEGQHSSVEADKAISGGVGVVTRKEKIVDVEHPASTKLVNVEMAVSQPQIGDISYSPDDQTKDISQQQRTKTMVLPETKGSAQKKQVSSDVAYAEYKFGPTATLKMATQRCEEFTEEPYAQLEQNQKQPEETMHDIKKTFTDSQDALRKAAKTDMPTDNSSIFQPDATHSETRRMVNTTTTSTVVKMVDNSVEQSPGIDVPYNQNSSQPLKSNGFKKDAMFQGTLMTSEVSATAPLSERMEIHTKRLDMNSDNLSKSLAPSNQDETPQLVYKTISDKLESSDVYAQKTVEESSPNVTENIQEIYASKVMESKIPEEQNVSDLTVITPKKKKSRKKKSLKGGENNGLDSSPKPEEPVSVNQEFCPSVKDGDESQSKTAVSSLEITRVETDNIPKTEEMATPKVDSLQEIYQNGTKLDLDKSPQNQAAFATSKQPAAEYGKLKSVSAEFPGQGAELGKDGELITKVVTTTERTTYEMNPEMQSRPEAYNIQSVTGKLPEKTKDPKLAGFQEQGDMFGKVTTTTKTIAYKTSEMPEEEFNVQKMSAEFPGQVEDPRQMEFTQGNLVDKVTTITKTSGYKIAPGMSERPEEYHVQSISADFPDQIKSPMQTDFTQGNTADKATPTPNAGAYKMVPGMSDKPEVYKLKSLSTELPAQQTELGKDGELITKVVESKFDMDLGTSPQNRAAFTTNKQPTVEYKTESQIKTSMLKSPQQERQQVQYPSSETRVTDQFKPGNDAITSPKIFETPSTDRKTTVTIVETKELMAATRESFEQLQFLDQNSSLDVSKDRTQSPISSKLTTTSYQMSSSVDNVHIPEPGRNSKERPSGINEAVYKKPEESLETAEPKYSIQDIPEKKPSEEKEKTPKEKSKKKKKNSSKAPSKGKENGTPSEEPARVTTTKHIDVSSGIPSQEKDIYLREPTKQADLPEKVITTSSTETTVTQISETPEIYNLQSAFGKFGNQGTLQTQSTQGNMADKETPTIKMAGYKMGPGMSDKSEGYKLKSISAEFPGQQAEFGKDGELITKVVTTTERTTYEMNPEMQSRPEAYDIQSVTGKLPEKTKDPKLVAFQEQGDMFGKVTTTTKTIAYKTSEMPEEEFNVQNMSAEFPGQVEGPKQMEFTQGNLVDKVATITKTSGYKIAPGMSERPEQYHVQSISAEFPDQIKSPMQTDFTQGNTANKATPTPNAGAYKMVPGMSDKPEVYKLQSLSTELPAQQTELGKDGELITKVTTITETTSYEVVPGIGSSIDLTSKNSPESEFNNKYNISTEETLPTKPVTMKTSERPEELQVPYVSTELPESSEDPHKMDSEKTSFFGRVASTIKSTFSKISPGVPDQHELPTSSISDVPAELSTPVDPVGDMGDQTSVNKKASVESEAKDGLASPTIKEVTPTAIRNVTTKPLDSDSGEIPQVTKQGGIPQKLITLATTKSITRKEPEGNKDYNVQSTSVEFPGQVKGAQQGECIQRNIIDEVDTTINSVAYKLPGQKDEDITTKVVTTTETSYEVDLGMQSRPEAYNIQSVPGKLPEKTKDPKLAGFQEQGDMFGKVTTTTKTIAYKTSEMPEEEFNVQKMSAEFPGQVEGPKQMDFTQGNLVEKITTITKTSGYKMAPGMSERPEEYNVQSFSAEFPDQIKSPMQTNFTQGNIVDKAAPTIQMPAYKMTPGKTDRPQEYNVQSISAEFPGQIKSPMQTNFTQGNIVDNAAPTIQMPAYKMTPGKTDRPQEYNVQSISAEFPGQIKSPMQTDFTQGNIVDNAAPTIQMPAYKMTPGKTDRPQEYNVQSISAEFPGQIKSPMQTYFTQGNIVDKAAPTIQMPAYKMTPGKTDRPQEYNVQSISAEFPGQIKSPMQTDFTQGNIVDNAAPTIQMPAYKMTPGKTDRPQEYNVQSISAEFPGQIKSPMQTDFTQGNIVDKAAPTIQMPAYKMTPGISDRPQEYNVQSISAEFPGQLKSPMQTDFTQGNIVDKAAPTIQMPAYKMTPGKTDRPQEYNVQSISAEFPGQIKSPMQTDFTQGYQVEKVVTMTVPADPKMVPQISDITREQKISSVFEDFPDDGSATREPGIKDQVCVTNVTTTETISENIVPEIPQNGNKAVVSPASKLPKEPAFGEQGDMFGKVVTTSKDIVYKTDEAISEKPLEFKAQTVSVEFPGVPKKAGMITEVETTGKISANKTEEIPAELPKKKSKSHGKTAVATKKGAKKMSEMPEESNTDSVPTATSQQPKEKQKKEKPGFLGKVATSLKSTFSKKSPVSTSKPEEFPELVKDATTPDVNAPNVPSDSQKVSYKSVVESGTVSPTVKTTSQKMANNKQGTTLGKDSGDSKVIDTDKTTDKVITEITDQYSVQCTLPESPRLFKDVQDRNIPEENTFREIPGQGKDAKLRKSKKQVDLPEKVITTSSTETTVTQISETPEIYNLQSASGNFGNQGTLQTQSTQGNMADKETPTIKMAGYKMGPGMSDKSEGYKLKSISAEFPGQQAEFGKDGELITKVVTTTEHTTYEMNPEMQRRPEAYNIQSVPGKLPEKTKDPKLAGFQEQGDMFGKVTTTTKTIAYKTSEMPEEEFNVQKMSAEFPGQVEGPRQMEFTQGNLVDKVATITKTSGYKMAPGMSERPEEYHVQSISAEFPNQIKSPMQTDFTQGNIADKAAPTIQMPAYKMAPGISERPQEYNIQTISAEFPEQIKSPMQTDFTQGNIVDKAAPTIQMPAYKMTPGISDRPQEYNVQSISAEFPEQIKSPMQSDFTQGYGIDKGTTIPASGGRKTVPELSDKRGLKVSSMPEEFPDLLEGPKYDEPPSPNGTPYMSQASYKAVLERGIKPMEHIVPPTTQSTDISFTTKTHQPNVSYTLNGNQPEEKTESLETLHFTLEKPVTTVKPLTHTLTTDLTDSPVDKATYFSVKSGATQIQEPTSTLSQYDPKSVIPSISTELPENLKSSDIDASVSYSTDFSTASAELGPRIQSKSWSDVVKTGKTVDANLDRSQPNISPSLSIDKVEKPGDRSPHIQQTENEDRTMSGGSETFAIISPDGTSLPEYAALSSGDVVAPLKSKPPPPAKPLLRKLSGHDFNVTDIQKTAKPALKLVAPDCTLLQTKFETDGWKPKVKSPTITKTMTTTIVQSELIRQSPDGDIKTQTPDLEHSSVLPPVAPKRRSREFRSMSEESTDGESASPTATLHFKTQVDIPVSSPQGHPPQPPKRRHKKSSKSNSGSMSPDVSGSKDFNLDDSKRVSQTEFRMSDQDVFRDSLPGPTSPLESETKQNVITEKVISLNKSPHVSITSDSVNVENLEELKTKPRVMPKPNLKETPDSYFVLDDSPTEKNPPFERSYSADKSRTLPLHRKKIGSHSNNSDSDSEEKKQQPLSPNSNQKRWKSVEFFKDNQIKPDADVPPKNTGLNRVKSTSIKLLSKLQPKSKKSKSPRPDKEEEDYSPGPHVKTGHGATKEYPTLEKYPVHRKSRRRGNKNKEPSSPRTPDSEKFQAAAAPVAPLAIPLPLEEDEEPVKERVYLSSWDPTPLLKELYEIRLMDDDTEDLSYKFIEMEGLMEKLPMNKKKATLLKTWKRRYFRAKNGWLVYYDNRNDEKPSDELLLMGGQIHAMGNQVIGIDDGGGRYLMVRCPSQKEYEQWLTALESQITDNTRATYVRPSLNALKHPNKKVVMIEFGSMSIRAGILKENATLPQLFFPNAVAVSNENNMVKHVIGFDAYKPEVRHSSQLVQPFGPTDKVDKFKVDFDTLPSVFTAIFKDLKIATEEYYVMLILPLNIRDEEKSILMNILINQFKVSGVCMAPQALLALYSYNTQSGIIVDIGERLEVLPIYEGFVIDGGHTVQSFGAPKIRQSLRSGLTSENYPLYSPLEQLLVRLVQEETCFVSKNFNEDCQQYQKNPEKYQETLYLKKYNIPDEIYTKISHSLSRFVSPEGLFNTDLWGMDYPTIQSLVMNAIQACPMDNRRHLCRSIYLSGGVTLLPGFASRLESELRKRLNETIVIQVHASPQRYHAAYIGACALCSMSEFEKSCITSEEWKKDGTKAFQKWKMTS